MITFDPAHAGKSAEEVKALLKEAGEDGEPKEYGHGGIFLLKVDNSKETVSKVKKIFQKHPDKFEYTYNWIPIEKWCDAKIDALVKEMKEIDERMDPDETWKLDLNKRQFDMPTMDLIVKLTDPIEKPKVDLKNPQKIVKIEIIGNKAGIALLDKDELLNVGKKK